MLSLKKISPTRLIKNPLYQRIQEAEDKGADAEDLREILGKAASKRGIFEGDTETGELEIGQIVSSINEIKPVTTIMNELISDFEDTTRRMAVMV